MSHKGIRTLIERTARSLGDDIQFGYGRESDFNMLRDKRYPFINVAPLTATASYTVDNVSNYMKVWTVAMAFYELDTEGSTADQYAKILDDTDLLADTFIQKLNGKIDLQGDIIISNVRVEAF